MAAFTKAQVLSLYRVLMKESKKFPSYNYRTYVLRRVRDAFRANRNVEDRQTIDRLVEHGYHNLELIKRQVLIGQMYESQMTIVEEHDVKNPH